MSRPTTKEFFVKERLAEVREARSITQKDLAKSLARADSTISNWERGEQAPEPRSLEQLASVLDVATRYFLKPMVDHGPSPIFFRSLASATKGMRRREKARVRWLQLISLSLQEILHFPPVDIPEFVEPGSYKKLKEDDLERIAMEMRAHWRLGEGPINNAVLVAENAGVVVGVDEFGSTKIDGQGTWSGFDSRPYILLSKDKYTAFRRQMDAAHELAHIVIHRGITESSLSNDFDLIEWQAKYLAGAFLLPYRSFASEIYSLSLDGFLELKKRWGVAVAAMIMRSRQLDLLSSAAAERLWKHRATRGWHRREPLDSPEETPVAEPRMLRRSIEMIISNNVRSKGDLLKMDIGLGARDVEVLASLDIGYFDDSPSTVVRISPKLRESANRSSSAQIMPFPRSG